MGGVPPADLGAPGSRSQQPGRGQSSVSCPAAPGAVVGAAAPACACWLPGGGRGRTMGGCSRGAGPWPVGVRDSSCGFLARCRRCGPVVTSRWAGPGSGRCWRYWCWRRAGWSRPGGWPRRPGQAARRWGRPRRCGRMCRGCGRRWRRRWPWPRAAAGTRLAWVPASWTRPGLSGCWPTARRCCAAGRPRPRVTGSGRRWRCGAARRSPASRTWRGCRWRPRGWRSFGWRRWRAGWRPTWHWAGTRRWLGSWSGWWPSIQSGSGCGGC